MSIRTKALAGIAAAGLVLTGVAAAPAANAAHGKNPVAGVLLSDRDTFDHNALDYDIVTQAALAVLKAKPTSPVKALTNGKVRLTAFIPNDKAFQVLVRDLTGKDYRTGRGFDERKVFAAVAGLGIDTVETVLLYHVVLGGPIDSTAALGADGAALTTAQGGTISVTVTSKPSIVLRDKDPDSRNPRVILSQVDLNKGNRQLAHGIDRVLRPVDL